jgi:hypothetical protein
MYYLKCGGKGLAKEQSRACARGGATASCGRRRSWQTDALERLENEEVTENLVFNALEPGFFKNDFETYPTRIRSSGRLFGYVYTRNRSPESRDRRTAFLIVMH